jgi:hypothetical protein
LNAFQTVGILYEFTPQAQMQDAIHRTETKVFIDPSDAFASMDHSLHT